MRVRLLLFAVRVTVRDALLGFPIGSAVRLRIPQRPRATRGARPSADLTVKSLPRGDYRVSVEALGMSSSRPIALSRDQKVDLRVISWLDVAVVCSVLGSIALALLFIRRPARAGRRRAAGLVSSVLVAVAALTATSPAGESGGRHPIRCSPTTTSGSTPARGIEPRSTIRFSVVTRATSGR